MDVRCTRCGVEYEFDEAKVTPAGVTVKCTSCGHVFKVKPEGVVPDAAAAAAAPASSPSGGEGGWTVRTTDGTTLSFKELTTLQKWIVEQKVGRRDEISKTGKSWKPLGEIAELASFFQVVDAARGAQGHTPTPTPTPTPAPQGGTPAAAPADEAAAGTTDPAAPAPASPPGDTLPEADEPRPPSVSGEFFSGDVLAELDDEDPVLQWRRRARARNAAVAVVVLAVGGVAALFFLARPTFDRVFGPALTAIGVTPADAPAESAAPDTVVERVDEILREDDLAALTALTEELAPLAAPDDASVARVAALARTHAALARRATDEARLLQAAGDGASPQSAAAAKRAQDELAKAYQHASRARSKNAASPEADLAFAAYQAAKGATAELEADLAAVQEKAAGSRADLVAEAEVLKKLGAAAAALDDDDEEAAKALAQQLPNSAGEDARLVVARLLLESRFPRVDDEKHRASRHMELTAVAEKRPRDARVKLLLAEAETETETESETETETETETESDSESESDSDSDSDSESEASGDKPKARVSYAGLMKKADRNRIRDRARAALKLYERAAELKPGAAKPWAGMGWCYIDMNQPKRAIGAFNQAIDRAPRLAEAYFGRAEAQRFSGDKSQAISSYERYLELAPTGPDAPVARNAIKSLQ